MGDPKKLKKNYWTQAHPWNKQAIETGKKLKQEYGLKNTKEILIASSFLKKYKLSQMTKYSTMNSLSLSIAKN